MSKHSKDDDKETKTNKQYKNINKEEKEKGYSVKEKTDKKNKKKPRKVMKTVVTILIILILLAFSFGGYKIYQNGGGLTGILATVLGEDGSNPGNLEPIQILVLGVSGVDNYKLADTIMIASYNPQTQSASLMSIPRDTYVGKKDRSSASQNYIASYKINAVYRNGTNIPEMMERINALTGLNLKNYLVIDTNALIKVVDAIGGVTFDVPIDMWYTDESQNLKIDLTAGEQLIDGKKAEQLLRFRHNDDGSTYPSSYGQQDLGRMKTQRNFVTATLKQTLQPKNIFKIKKIMDIMTSNVNTNLDVNTLKKYVPFAVKFNADNLKTGMLPGDVGMSNGVSIYIANKNETKTLVEELFGFTPKIESSNSTTTTNKTNTTKSSETTKSSTTTKSSAIETSTNSEESYKSESADVESKTTTSTKTETQTKSEPKEEPINVGSGEDSSSAQSKESTTKTNTTVE